MVDRGVSDNFIISNTAHNSLLTTASNYEAQKDIGCVHIGSKVENNSELLSTKTLVLNDIYREIGNDRVVKRNLNFAPSWIVDEAFNTEMH